MNLITKLLVGAVFLGISEHTSYCQTVDTIATGFESNFRGVKDIHVVITTEKRLEPAYQKIEHTSHPDVPTVFEFNYWQKGDSFNYTLYDKTPVIGKGFLARQARIGSYDQYLTNLDGGRLVLTHHPQSKIWLDTENFLFLPYAFLTKEKNADPAGPWPTMPSIQDLLDPALLKRLAGNPSVSIKSDPADPDIISLTFNVKGMEGGPRVSTVDTYKVKLSMHNGFLPIGYDRFDDAGRIVGKVECQGFTSIKTPGGVNFTYPREVSYRGYDESGTLLMTITSRADLVEINSITAESEEELFNVDPSLANNIDDRDNHVWIKVPR